MQRKTGEGRRKSLQKESKEESTREYKKWNEKSKRARKGELREKRENLRRESWEREQKGKCERKKEKKQIWRGPTNNQWKIIYNWRKSKILEKEKKHGEKE